MIATSTKDDGTTLTAEKVIDMVRQLSDMQPKPFRPRIIITDSATKRGRQFFKDSKHRSKRILKKLLKRFGAQYEMLPACWHHEPSNTIYLHPALERDMRAITEPAQIGPATMFGPPIALYGVPIYRGEAARETLFGPLIRRDPWPYRLIADA